MMIGTVASEFACYSFEYLATLSELKLRILYFEAIRQRTAKYSHMAIILNRGWQDDAGRRKIDNLINRYLDPYTLEGSSDSGCDVLRAKKR